MNEPKPLFRCDLCGSFDYNDDVRGCLRCGFDEMKPIAPGQQAGAPLPLAPSEADQERADFLTWHNDRHSGVKNAWTAWQARGARSDNPASNKWWFEQGKRVATPPQATLAASTHTKDRA